MLSVSLYIYRTPFEKVIPRLLEKALSQDLQCCILTPTEDEAEALSTSLWTYTPLGFLPHGTLKDGFFDQHPIVLTSALTLPQQKDILFIYSSIPSIDWIQNFKRCFHFIPHALADSTLKDVLEPYLSIKSSPQIWEQTAKGGWEKRSQKPFLES